MRVPVLSFWSYFSWFWLFQFLLAADSIIFTSFEAKLPMKSTLQRANFKKYVILIKKILPDSTCAHTEHGWKVGLVTKSYWSRKGNVWGDWCRMRESGKRFKEQNAALYSLNDEKQKPMLPSKNVKSVKNVKNQSMDVKKVVNKGETAKSIVPLAKASI